MTRRSGLVLIGLVTLALTVILGNHGDAQQPQSDPQQMPDVRRGKPSQRAWWSYAQRAFPLDDIPPLALPRALEEIRQARVGTGDALVDNRTTAAIAMMSPSIGDGSWVNIGPAPIARGQIGQALTSRPVSGRVADIAVDPWDPTHWLIGAAQGGIWGTRDAGGTWTPLTDGQASLAMGAIAFAPGNQGIIYAGTGEAAFSGPAYAGAGLLKSTDGGNTWTLLAAATFANSTFSDIRVSPKDPNIVLAATAYGYAGRSYQTRPPSVPPTGVLKSRDGGLTWKQTLPGIATDLEGIVPDIEVVPGYQNFLLAGIGNPNGSPENGVYRSNDEGDTWTRVAGPWNGLAVGRVELSGVEPQGIMYVSIQDSTTFALLGLWRTDNVWALAPTWTQIPTTPMGGYGYCGMDPTSGAKANCHYDHEIIMEPRNPDTLYAGGVALWKCENCRGAGAIWTEISKTASDPQNGIHVDQQTMAWARYFRPVLDNYANQLIVGNDGGVWSTFDKGATWTDHNTNLSITQFYEGSIDISAANVVGGTQDNGTVKRIGSGLGWDTLRRGDGADNAISLNQPYTHWAVSYQHLEIERTTDGGITYVPASGGIDTFGSGFIARFEMCPSDDNVFIAGASRLFKKTDFFTDPNPGSDGTTTPPAWTGNSPSLRTMFDTAGNLVVEAINAMAFAPSDASCQTYAFGTTWGQLRLTRDGGTNWVDIDVGNAVPDRWVTDLAFDSVDANVLYVTLSGFDEGTPGQPGHVFKTTDALAASPFWLNVSPPVNIPHNTIVVTPQNPNLVYVGTDVGVWSTNSGGTLGWTHMGPSSGMPNVAVFELQMNRSTKWPVAFTHGRGAFEYVAPNGPDIEVSPWSADYGNVPVAASNDKMFVVKNWGNADLTVSDVFIGGRDPGQFTILSGGKPFILAPGATRDVTVRFGPNGVGSKNALLWFLSDDPNEDHYAVTLSGTATGLPDLAVSALSNAPFTATPGGSFTVTDTTYNSGSLAGASTTRYRLSLDATMTPSDPLLTGARAVPNLPAGVGSTGTVTVTVPATLATGTYFLGACADDLNAVAESSESNNCWTSTTIVVTRPDLVVSDLTSPPTVLTAGGSFAVRDTTTNIGTGQSGTSTTRYRLSLDANITNADPLLTGTRSVPVLPAGAGSVATVTVRIPTSLTSGTYFLGACADNLNAVAESDETNNCRASATTMQVTRPDLVVSAVSPPPASTSAGSTFSVTDTTTNIGSGSAGASTTRYRLSLDASITTSDPLLTGTRPVPGLAAGIGSTGAVVVTVPATLAAGTYFLAGCADNLNAVSESIETNNCRTSATTMQVTKPDLVVSGLTNPPATAKVGSIFSVTDTTTNTGSAPAAASTTRYRLSLDTNVTSADPLLSGTRSIASLPSGASSTGTTSVIIPTTLAPGTYFLGACADNLNVVPEITETNNCRVAATPVIVSQ
jgi:CARDB protein/HYDIN/CFA65/VesB family protein